MSKRTLIIAGVLGGVVILMIVLLVVGGKKGCNPKNPKCKPPTNLTDEKITLTYWRPFDTTDKFQDLIDQYHKEHSNITIEYHKQDPKDYEQSLVENFARDGGPDLFSIGNTWIPKFQDKIVPAEEDQIAVDDINRNFFPVVKTDSVINNKVYAVPYSVETLALFVNTELLRKADLDPSDIKTWADISGDVDEAGRPIPGGKPGGIGKLTVLDGRIVQQSAIALGSSKVNRAQDILAMMLLQQRKDVMTTPQHDKAIFDLSQKDDTGKSIFYGQRALNYYTSFAQFGHPNYSYNGDFGDTFQAFSQGKVAMVLGYPHDIARLKTLNPNLKYAVVPAPQFREGDPVNYANYQTEVVSKKSKHQKEAWDFIKYVSRKENLPQFTVAADLPSSRKDVPAGGANLGIFYAQSPTAVSWYQGDYVVADQVFLKMIADVLNGIATDTAIKQAAVSETANLLKIKQQLEGAAGK